MAAILVPLAFVIAEPCAAQVRDSTVIPMKNVVVTALRTPTSIDSVPFGISLVERDEGSIIRATGDLAARVPGLQADNRSNYANGDRIALRGFGARSAFGVRGIRVFVDDVPATFADGQSALEILDPGILQRAEVLRGASSALYGNAAGGVIRFGTITPSVRPWSMQLTADGDGGGLFRSRAIASGTAGAADYRLGYSRLHDRGWREHSGASFDRFFGSTSWRPDSGSHLDVSAAYVGFDAMSPGALTRAQLDSAPTAAALLSLRRKTREGGTHAQLGVGYRRAFGGTDFSMDVYGIRRTIDNTITTRMIDLSRWAGGTSARLSVPLNVASGLVLIGGEVEMMSDDRKAWTNVDGGRGAVETNQRERVDGTGAYAELIARPVDPFLITASVRYDHTHFGVKDALVDSTNPDDSGDRLMSAFSPALGLVYSPMRGLDVFGNVGTSFETPTTTELANRPDAAGGFNAGLGPQRSIMGEIGIRTRPFGAVSLALVGFSTWTRDELIPFEVESSPGRVYYRNAGSTRRIGAEFSAQVRLRGWLTADIAWSWMDARFADYSTATTSFDGNRVPGIPTNRATMNVTVFPTEHWIVGADATYRSRMTVDDAGANRADAYAILDLRTALVDLALPLGIGSIRPTVTVGVSNLFDTRYAASVIVNAAGNRYFEPGAGRTLYAGVSLGIEDSE